MLAPGDLQWEQDGQHSPSTKDGLAHVAGEQVIWWHTVLNFWKNRKIFGKQLCNVTDIVTGSG